MIKNPIFYALRKATLLCLTTIPLLLPQQILASDDVGRAETAWEFIAARKYIQGVRSVEAIQGDLVMVTLDPGVVGSIDMSPATLAALGDPATYQQPSRWVITSADDAAYGTSGKSPLQVGRRSYLARNSYDPSFWDYYLNIIHHHDYFLKLPTPLVSGKTYTIRAVKSDLDPRMTDRTVLSFDQSASITRAIKVNQVAYSRLATRRYAYLGFWAGSLGKVDYSTYPRFSVINEITNTTALSDQPITLRRDNDINSGEKVFQMDISTLGEGRYHIVVPGLGRSDTFHVGGRAVQDVYFHAARSYFHQRLAQPLGAPHTWVTKESLFGEIWESGNVVGGEPSSKLQPPPIHQPAPGETKRAFSGGYRDAADFDSFTHHLFASLHLLHVFELFPGQFLDNDLNIPESGNGIPDLLDEVDYGIKTFLELQNPDGSVPYGRGNESDGFKQNLLWMIGINFQDNSYTTPWDYTADNGSLYGSKSGGQTYGWNVDHTANVSSTTQGTDPLEQTHIMVQSTGVWEIALPNNEYTVKVVVGDASTTSVNTVNVEGVNYFSNRSLSNTYATVEKKITVKDGKLTIDAAGSTDLATRICYLTITREVKSPCGILPPNRNSTETFAAMAAYYSRIIAPYNPAKAATYLAAARSAWGYASTHTYEETRKEYSVPDKFTILPSRDSDFRPAALAWAAAELSITTGEANYTNYLVAHSGDFLHWWNRPRYWSYLISKSPHVVGSIRSQIENTFWTFDAKSGINQTEQAGYRVGMGDSNISGWGRAQGGGQYGLPLLMAWWLTEDQQYLDLACFNADFYLGANPLSRCSFTGMGARRPNRPEISWWLYERPWDDLGGDTVEGIPIYGIGPALKDYPGNTLPTSDPNSRRWPNWYSWNDIWGRSQEIYSEFTIQQTVGPQAAFFAGLYALEKQRGLITRKPFPRIGRGLTGEYFDNQDFTSKVLSRNDATIGFNWLKGSPDWQMSADTFSVRWTGKIQPLYTETYTFRMKGNGGVRLWINNQQLINSWSDGAKNLSASISLNANSKVDIRVEYFDSTDDAGVTLQWESASQGNEIVPRSQLYPSVNPVQTGPSDLTAPNLTIESPADEASFSGSLAFSGSASDVSGVDRIEWRVNEAAWQNASGASSWSFTLPSQPNGSHTVEVRATDASPQGNQTTQMRTVVAFSNSGSGSVNVAANGTISGYSSQQGGNEAFKIIDGIADNDTNRWSASGVPQWIEIDLGSDKSVNRAVLHTYLNRDYTFMIEGRAQGGSHQMLADKRANTSNGPIDCTFPAASVRYIKLTITGAATYTGTWVSIGELEVFSAATTSTNPINLATSGTVSARSGEQSPNIAENAIDGIDNSDNNRWSADGFPQFIEVDLGANYSVSGTEIVTFQSRAYQFNVQVKPAGGSYSTVVNRSSNTAGSPIANTFAPVTARYLKLTVTGASGYTGSWVTIREFKILGN